VYSASLISMIVHSLPQEPKQTFLPPPSGAAPTAPRAFTSQKDIADALSGVERQFPFADWPAIPVVGWSSEKESNLREWLDNFTLAPRKSGGRFIWGRIPVNRLIRYFSNAFGTTSDQEYFDLGTPLQALAAGSPADKECDRLLQKTASAPGTGSSNSAKLGIAIIDSGTTPPPSGAPRDYSRKLRHAVPNVDLSDHAEKVLYVLLERIEKTIIADVTVSCALVFLPTARIGLGLDCFKQDCATELLDAATALVAALDKDKLDAVVNLSLGTHVGPHNGSSPLEQYISQTLTQTLTGNNKRFLVAAAGNEGGKGLSAKRILEASETEFLILHTGPRCKDLLVEFWWDDSGNTANLSITVLIYETTAAGGRNRQASLKIDPSTKSILTAQAIGLSANLVASSLCTATSSNGMSCIAFALSASPAYLPATVLEFEILATRKVVVNAWIAVAERDPETAFREGGQEGSITVPACDLAVLSVAGVTSSKQMWSGTSRGPAAQYTATEPPESSPLMAHLPNLSGDYGTSFASPRAAGDVAVVVADPARLAKCSNAKSLVLERYGGSVTWNKRYGYHRQTS
jgi:hypothetical protein